METKEIKYLTDYPKMPLLNHQQRGYLEYESGDGVFLFCSGWFWLSLDGRTVIRRKIGGRNCYQFAKAETATFYKNENAK